ncbi:o-succinylbenzoate--CoA ligase [Amycolatopsis sp. YIM 10]|uniref:o-succinylbenzoate--CoA ligase n=1 Tax=Amycolatopsis sp. YIM 10 TaxID=2653857 RepID=UPI0012900A4B|nr:o-succinylbenzoate--CoA ligase [Amycolatopsis sp. YIM 10]QFU94166.1 2-succinylbenzoate--CoA ligase [Amycolatopsis sp. YIM 10]
MRVVAEFSELPGALAAALDGGPAVLPVGDPALAEAMRPDLPVEDGTAVIIATSGSTGAPKGVLLSAAALRASAEATHERLGGPGRWLLATPPQYIGGLQVLVRSMLAGTSPVVLDSRAGFRATDFADGVRELVRRPGPHYSALVPTQLSRLVDAGPEVTREVARLDAIVLGGAALDPGLAERAASAGITAVPAYGMSETASGCVYQGVPLSGVDIRIGGGGRVEIAGSVLAHGYRLNPELTAESFVDGWFRTSDLGRFDDGRLTVLGRADDVINTGGVKVPAAAVERALLAHPSVRAVCVVGVPDPEWGEAVVAAVVPAKGPLPEDELRALVRAEAGAAAVPKRLLALAELPLRGPGKVDRSGVRTLAEQG